MKRIRTKLIGTFFSSIFLLAIISLYINFFSSKLSRSVYEMSFSKRLINDVVLYSSSIINTLSFYIVSDFEKQIALKSEYDYSIEKLNDELSSLKSFDQFKKTIIIIQSDVENFSLNAQKIFDSSSERAAKEEKLKQKMTSLHDNDVAIENAIKNKSQSLKLIVAQMIYDGVEFNFHDQGSEYSEKWIVSISNMINALEENGVKAAFLPASNYRDLAKEVISLRSDVNDLKIKEQYYMDNVKNIYVEINVASNYISKAIDGQLSAVLDQSSGQRTLSWIILVISFVAGGYIVFLVSQKIVDSIDSLVLAAKKVSEGNLEQRVEIKSDDELGYLSKIFNQMMENIGKSQSNLKKTEKQLEQSNIELETKVKERTAELENLKNNLEKITVERTKELENKINELERFKELSVGRELKMIELKKEIERLKKIT